MELDHPCLHYGRKNICTPGEPCLTFCNLICQEAQAQDVRWDWEDYQKQEYWEE